MKTITKTITKQYWLFRKVNYFSNLYYIRVLSTESLIKGKAVWFTGYEDNNDVKYVGDNISDELEKSLEREFENWEIETINKKFLLTK